MLSARYCLFIGLGLGAAITWAALPSAPSSARFGSSAAAGPVIAPAWSWRQSPTPPRFSEGASAVSAWLRLRAPDGRPLSYSARAASLLALVLRLPASDFPRLIEALSQTRDDDDIRLRYIAFTAWLGQEASAATRWALGQDETANDLIFQGIREWTRQDPESAVAWALALPDNEDSRTLAALALDVLAEKNPERALALVRSRRDALGDAMRSSLIYRLGQRDPAGTVRTFAPDLWKNGQGFYTFQSTIEAWVKQDSTAALAWLLAQPHDATDEIASTWIARLGGSKPSIRRTLADAIVANPDVKNPVGVLSGLFSIWSADQPTEALAWLKNERDPALRSKLLELATSRFDRSAPERSLPLVLAMPDGKNRTDAISERLSAWAKADPDAALSWFKANGSEPAVAEASSTIHGTLLGELAREDVPSALANWQALDSSELKNAARRTITAAWGEKDPGAALKWAETQKPAHAGPYYDYNQYLDLIQRWSRTDPEAALRWVEKTAASLPSDEDRLAGKYLDALGGSQGDKAPRATTADLFAKIQDPRLRLNALKGHISEWVTKDPAGARTWIADNPNLTKEHRTALLSFSRQLIDK